MSHFHSSIVVVWIVALGALALVAQEPTPTKKIQLSPSAVVEAYIKAIAANDLAALSKTYTRPLEGIYRSLAAFRAEHYFHPRCQLGFSSCSV